MIELKSPNPSGYDTKYIINFHKPDVSVQQTEYSDVLKRLNEKLAVGSISKETYDEAVTAVYRRFPALTENLSDLQEISKSENKDTLPELLSEGIEKINEISVNTENTENKSCFPCQGFRALRKNCPKNQRGSRRRLLLP